MINKLLASIVANATVSVTGILAYSFSNLPEVGTLTISFITAIGSIYLGLMARKDNLLVKRAEAEKKRAEAREINAKAALLEQKKEDNEADDI